MRLFCSVGWTLDQNASVVNRRRRSRAGGEAIDLGLTILCLGESGDQFPVSGGKLAHK